MKKVSRAEKLLSNLQGEKTRWEKSSNDFKEQITNIVGNVLLSGAFLTYIGFFDHLYRKSLMISWKQILDQEFFKFRQNLELIEFLSQPIERH